MGTVNKLKNSGYSNSVFVEFGIMSRIPWRRSGGGRMIPPDYRDLRGRRFPPRRGSDF